MNKELQNHPNPIKVRDYWFDNAKAILIVLVVVAHLAETLINHAEFAQDIPQWLWVIYRFIYIFHMPVFLIVSGRFAKKRIDNNDWVSVINKLILPYMLVQTVMMVAYSGFGYASISKFSYLAPLFGLWYLLDIALYQLVTPHVKKLRGLFVLAVIVALIISFGQAAPYGVFMRFFMFYPFFLFGYLTYGKDFKFCRNIGFRILSVLALAALLYAVWKYPQYFKVSLLTGKRVYKQAIEYWDMTELQYVLFLLVRYLAGFMCFFFVMGISPVKKTLFSKLGTESTYIYILHLFVIVALGGLAKNFGTLDVFGTSKKAAVFVATGVPLVFLLVSGPVKKVTSWLVAPKFDIRKMVQKIIEK